MTARTAQTDRDRRIDEIKARAVIGWLFAFLIGFGTRSTIAVASRLLTAPAPTSMELRHDS